MFPDQELVRGGERQTNSMRVKVYSTKEEIKLYEQPFTNFFVPSFPPFSAVPDPMGGLHIIYFVKLN